MKRFLILLLSAVLVACHKEEPTLSKITLVMATGSVPTRAGDPDAQTISDYNLLIFNSFGLLEEKVYVPRRQLVLVGGKVRHSTTLFKEGSYTILAAANLGYELPVMTLGEAMAYRFFLAYPDEYSRGVPMAACLEEFTPGSEREQEIPLQRLMARVDLQMDRTALDSGVSLEVTDVRVGNCPSSATLFRVSKAETADQVFGTGFYKSGLEVAALNRDVSLGLSGTVSVFLLENCQGETLHPTVCSFIEIRAEYHSSRWHTSPSSRLVYRFYLKEGENYDVTRNTQYSVRIKPRGDGLPDEEWRVDKSGLIP